MPGLRPRAQRNISGLKRYDSVDLRWFKGPKEALRYSQEICWLFHAFLWKRLMIETYWKQSWKHASHCSLWPFPSDLLPGVPETWGATNCLCLRFSDQRLNEQCKTTALWMTRRALMVHHTVDVFSYYFIMSGLRLGSVFNFYPIKKPDSETDTMIPYTHDLLCDHPKFHWLKQCIWKIGSPLFLRRYDLL